VTYAFDPELAAVLDHLPPMDLSDIPTARKTMAEMASQLAAPDRTGVDVTDRHVPGPDGAPQVQLRIYRSQDSVETGENRPLVYNIHGGGFVIGDLDMEDEACLYLVRELGAVVVSVDYRLAPEHPFPAGLEDCYAGLRWAVAHAGELGVDPAHVAVRGYSAGGGLSAALALLARDRGGPAIAFQYLGVPEVDDRLGTPSMGAFTDTPLWNRPAAEVSWDAYLGSGVRGTDAVSPYAAPARATDLSGLPPAYVSAMHFDPLRDEGVVYAQSLLAAGVPVELHLFPGTFHGSRLVRHALISQREAAEEIEVLRRALRL
jgi:acetyl esterase/lipase